MTTFAHAYKIEEELPPGMDRKAEFWPHVERHWLARLGRTLEPQEAEEVVSILKGIFVRKFRAGEGGVGAAIQFSKALFNEAYRIYKNDSRRVKPVVEAKCDRCGEPLEQIGSGYECGNDGCDMFGVGINVASIQERPQCVSLDEQLEAGGDDAVIQLDLYTAANDEIKGEFRGEILDERMVLLLKSVSEADRKAVLGYISEEQSLDRAATANGTNARSLMRRLITIGEKIENGEIRGTESKEEAAAPAVVETTVETIEPAQEDENAETHTSTPVHSEVADLATFTRREGCTAKAGHRRRDPGRTRALLLPSARASGPRSTTIFQIGGRSQLKRRDGPRQTTAAFRRDYGRYAVC